MLSPTQSAKLLRFGQALIDQERARVIISPNQPKSGFWFGGGNMAVAEDGAFYLAGRYRNAGDSRTGLGMGERGLELAIFKSVDRGETFQKLLSIGKGALGLTGKPALSIEGSALCIADGRVELYVSSEKANSPYPQGLEDYQKPGTGVWTIDRLTAATVEELKGADIGPLLHADDARYWHVKDPLLYHVPGGDLVLGFCTHPYCWTSSNSGYAVRGVGAAEFAAPQWDFLPRGATWDVAMTRLTCLLPVPQVGEFAGLPPLVLMFYDGGECVRNHQEHAKAVSRPRGYSCEELGGLAVALEDDLASNQRLSVNLPAFVSPWGTGCSRYVDVLETDEGYYATWEQSQRDDSQPLVMHFMAREEAEAILR